MKHPSHAWFLAALLGAGAALGACASSEDETGGNAGSAGSGGSAGSAGAGTGGSGGGSGGTGGGTGGSAGSAGSSTGGTGGTVDLDAGPPINISGIAETLALGGSPAPIADMKVCVYGVPSVPCVMTSATGAYTVQGAPGNQEILLEFTKTSFFPVMRTITTGTVNMDVGAIQYPTESQVNLFGTLVGQTVDKTKGQVLAMALVQAEGGTTFVGGEPGVTVAMTPMSGAGPFYTSDAGAPDTSATATSSTGIALYANVNPGEVEVEMTHPTKTCTRYADSAWAGSTATSSRVPVIAGYIVGGAVLGCPP